MKVQHRGMAFMPQLRMFLKGMRAIYTVRKYKMDAAVVEVLDVGICKRLPLGIISRKEELEPYVAESGFPTVEAWWSKIKAFIPYGETMYIYKVEVVENEQIKSS